MSGLFLGINLHVDPAVGLVHEGKLLAFSEEERHTRNKHALGRYPSHALAYCLATAGASIDDVTALAVNWDLEAYSNGQMKAFYEGLRRTRPSDSASVDWQDRNLRALEARAYQESHFV